MLLQGIGAFNGPVGLAKAPPLGREAYVFACAMVAKVNRNNFRRQQPLQSVVKDASTVSSGERRRVGAVTEPLDDLQRHRDTCHVESHHQTTQRRSVRCGRFDVLAHQLRRFELEGACGPWCCRSAEGKQVTGA
jgi:hypothetical protein